MAKLGRQALFRYLGHCSVFFFFFMWTLWEECNSHTFDDMKRWAQLIELFVGLLVDLSRAGVSTTNSNSIADFLESLSFCA